MIKNKIHLNLEDLAPISVSVYNRIAHFKNCIKSLAANDLAKNSVLYIFSDGAKPGDEKAVLKVREYARSIKGFKNVKFFFQKKNNFYKNVKNRIIIPLQIHGKIIRLEDDNIVSSNFLKYMNEALIYYKNNLKVISISGWTHPKMSNFRNRQDNFLSQYHNGWGYAFWSNRNVHKQIFKTNNYLETINNKKLKNKIKIKFPNLLNNLKKMYDSNLSYADYNMTFYQIKNNKFQVKPFISFVNNTGHDGSGINCDVNNNFDNKELNYKKKFSYTKSYNPNLDKIYFKFVSTKENFFFKVLKKISFF